MTFAVPLLPCTCWAMTACHSAPLHVNAGTCSPQPVVLSSCRKPKRVPDTRTETRMMHAPHLRGTTIVCPRKSISCMQRSPGCIVQQCVLPLSRSELDNLLDRTRYNKSVTGCMELVEGPTSTDNLIYVSDQTKQTVYLFLSARSCHRITNQAVCYALVPC